MNTVLDPSMIVMGKVPLGAGKFYSRCRESMATLCTSVINSFPLIDLRLALALQTGDGN